ncbi:lysoplasmalogenase [Risungbinella massiliensis]|uniref:lysoplasmalogenase n=1 Tax=Risungbinella massiliensis TaxID=1329796 RepID=UPI00069A9B2D|nr:lysoplasmalogenase [Risungbinella massiliensis]
MLICLLLFVGLSIGGYLVAITCQAYTWKYVLKPGTMVLIMIIAYLKVDEVGIFGWLILLGLFFSMLGDIFLMLPSDRFILGLVSFFIAHVIYVVAFPAKREISGVTLFEIFVLVAIATIFFLYLRSGVNQEGGIILQVAVLLYISVISLMVFRALQSGMFFLIVGAFLFYLSDAILAWNRFVRKYRWGELGVMITYFLAQTLFAVSLWFL